MSQRFPIWRALAAAGLMWACKSQPTTTSPPPPPPPPPPPSAYTMTANAGDNQSAAVGTAVAMPPSVHLTGPNDLAGVGITFAVTGGGGTITGATQTTDATGVAQVGSWTLGTSLGANTMTATSTGVVGSPITFTATATAGAAASVAKQGGDAQTANAGTAVPFRPAVVVRDARGNAVPNASVAFLVTQGGGTAIGGNETTGVDGTATVGSWTLGQVAGANALLATVAGSGISGNPVTFTATGVAGPAASITKVTGDTQTAVAGQAVAIAPSVKVVDFFGNPVGNQSVTFAAAAGSGSVTGSPATTTSAGIATLGSWILGAVAGSNSLTASTSTVPSVSFTATGLAPLLAMQYQGIYSGTWTNQTFASTGTTTITVTVNASTSSATFTLVGTGMVLGTAGGVMTGAQPVTYGATNATLQSMMPVMGTVTATMDGAGNFVASGVNIPNAAISRWDAHGTVTPTQIQISFTVTFVSGSPSTATGTITLTHQS